MERFGSIGSADQIQRLCRLCGMENPGMMPICEDFETDVIDLDDDPSLQRKIEECIGILVHPNDKLPQNCCGICTDKICDFFEFRLMCTSTDIQTRRLLGLGPREVIKKEELPHLTPATTAKSNFHVQPSKIKIEDPVLMEIAPPPDYVEESRRQQAKNKKRNMLEPMIQLKRIKIEKEEINCSVCMEKFTSEGDKYAHMYTIHVPNFAKYGCSSCGIAFDQLEWRRHRNWHTKHNKPYFCHRCGEAYDKYTAFSKHFQNNRCSDPPLVTQSDIQCELCRKKFSTRNLYEWHACFIKNKTNCRKCGQYYANKQKLFMHFLKCPLPFIDIVSKPVATEKVSKAKKTVVRTNENNIKTEDDLDISALLETSLHETGKDDPCTTKISSLLESVNNAIDKISAEKAKNKEERKPKKKVKKVTPLKLQIKPDPGAKPQDEEEEDDDLEHIPAEEHFAEVCSDSDDDSTSQTTNTETSGSVTPAMIRIKKEKLDEAYGDKVTTNSTNEKDPIEEETLQDMIRNIKKEPDAHSQEEIAAVLKAAKTANKSINPLAMKKKKNSLTRQQLILKIKKEKSGTSEDNNSSIRKALNPLAAGAAKKRRKLLRIPSQLALRIKKEKAKNKNKAPIVPNIQIKQEKRDSDEEHHEGPIETDYLGINPLSLLKQNKKANVTQSDQDSNGDINGASTEIPAPVKSPIPSTSTPNPISSIFGKQTGFMKLSLNPAELEFGASEKRSSPVQMPVISNIVSGDGLSFPEMEEKGSEESEVTNNDEKTDEKEAETTTTVVLEKPIEVPPVTNEPKMGGFMKISGMTGGFLQFPGIQKPPNEVSKTPVTESIVPNPPTVASIIPGLGMSSGFKKLSTFSLAVTPKPNHDEATSPSKNPTENIQMPVISNISTAVSNFDLDDLISSPPHPSDTDIDMESFLNEKLLDEEKLNTNCDNNGTDDFLKELDEHLANN